MLPLEERPMSSARHGHLRMLRILLIAASVSGCALSEPALDEAAQAVQLPAGFQIETFATGLVQPTAMAIAPDGRIFVAQQTGAVRVVKNEALLPTPFVSLTVDSQNE